MIKFSKYDIKTNPYKYFFVKLFALFVFVFVFDFLIGNVLGYYYFKNQRNYEYRTTYAIDSTKANLLIFGSSRASHDYQPDIFQKCLSLTCYNVGRDGNFLFYHYAILEAVLKRYSPKMIILDFMHEEFSKDKVYYDRLSSLLPYYRKHPEMRSIIKLRSPFEKLKLLSRIYPYNSSILTIVRQNIFPTPEIEEDIKGYLPLTGVWNEPIQNENNLIKYEIDSTEIKVYESFIQDCINSKIKLYIICSPYFYKSTHTDYSVKIAQEIAKKYNVKFFDYSQDTTFMNNPKLFDDPMHLNNEGAKIFSNKITERIATYKNK